MPASSAERREQPVVAAGGEVAERVARVTGQRAVGRL